MSSSSNNYSEKEKFNVQHCLKIELFNEPNIDVVYEFFNIIQSSMEDKSQFVVETEDEIKSYLFGNGFVVVVKNHQNTIVGCLTVKFPSFSADNLGYDISLKNDELLQVAHIESVAVLNEYRGLGLQSRMIKFAVKHIDKEKYKYLLATVSPKNYPSKKSFEANGFSLICMKKKYGGLERGIFFRKML